jgi:hypothetical protein
VRARSRLRHRDFHLCRREMRYVTNVWYVFLPTGPDRSVISSFEQRLQGRYTLDITRVFCRVATFLWDISPLTGISKVSCICPLRVYASSPRDVAPLLIRSMGLERLPIYKTHVPSSACRSFHFCLSRGELILL